MPLRRLPLTPLPLRAAATGFILGVLLGLGARTLGLRAEPGVLNSALFLIAGAVGAFLAAAGARRLLWIAGALECLALLVISYTPLVPALMHAWVRRDALRPADAVVSLSSQVYPDGSLDTHAQLRVLHAEELLSAGWAPRLVLTRIAGREPSALPVIRRQMRLFGLRCPIDEVGPVRNTHDEALAVAALARRRGWRRVILVSDPDHLRRAGAVFAHAGLEVCCSPAPPPATTWPVWTARVTAWPPFAIGCTSGSAITSITGAAGFEGGGVRCWVFGVRGFRPIRPIRLIRTPRTPNTEHRTPNTEHRTPNTEHRTPARLHG